MTVCWSQEPESRPKMEEIIKMIKAPGFGCLRAKIALNKSRQSCACVCQILPELESKSDLYGSSSNFNLSAKDGGICQGQDSSGYKIQAREIERWGQQGRVLNSQTRIVICGHDDLKWYLQIITFIDGHPGYHVSSVSNFP